LPTERHGVRGVTASAAAETIRLSNEPSASHVLP
jgi:hypothetical protein